MLVKISNTFKRRALETNFVTCSKSNVYREYYKKSNKTEVDAMESSEREEELGHELHLVN